VNAFCSSPSSLKGEHGQAIAEGRGVEILRVHDWRGARESVKMAKALYSEQ